MAVTSKSGSAPSSSFSNATTGPYTLAAAQATGYTGGSSTSLRAPTPTIIAAPQPAPTTTPGSKTGVVPTPLISYTAPIPVAPVINLGGGPSKINTVTGVDSYATTPKVAGFGLTRNPTPVALPKAPITPIANNVNNFRTAYGATKGGTRDAYNKSIGYDVLTTQQKRIADNVYNTTKKRDDDEDKKNNTNLISDLEKNPLVAGDLYLDTQKKTDADAIAAKEAALQQARDEQDAADQEAQTQQAELETEQNKYTAEQEESAKEYEGNRLNQVRGDIMQVLAQRGVDISKLSPEQITALSGEQGSKAFTDIFDTKEKVKSNIKTARDKTLAQLQTLRSNKNITKATYDKQVNSINEITNSKLLAADSAYKNSIMGLVNQKKETGTTVATTITNLLAQKGIPLSAQGAFSGIINSSTSAGEALSKIMSSTDPAVQKAYKDAEQAVKDAAAVAAQLDYAKIAASNAGQKDATDILIGQLQDQAAREYAVGNTAGAKGATDQANRLIAAKMGVNLGTPSNGAGTVAP